MNKITFLILLNSMALTYTPMSVKSSFFRNPAFIILLEKKLNCDNYRGVTPQLL